MNAICDYLEPQALFLTYRHSPLPMKPVFRDLATIPRGIKKEMAQVLHGFGS